MCALHAYLTLPSFLFPDKYQLSSPLFLASKNLRSVRSISGESDLEAPDWIIKKWGSAMLIEINTPPLSHVSKPGSWHAEVPLHLRYLGPAVRGVAHADFPWPVLFWACTAEEGNKMSVNPFDRVNLGYDGLFGAKTMFYHLDPNMHATTGNGSLIERLNIPVLNAELSSLIETGTVVIVIIGFLWVSFRLMMAGRSTKTSGNVTIGSERKAQ